MREHKKGVYEKYIKRYGDMLLSIIALIGLSPIMLALLVLVRIRLGKPVIFKQERPGRIDERTGKEQVFTLYKFRTMTDKKDMDGKLLADEERLTTFGKWLRSTSLDELPELINIIRGDMSIVGPRPLLVRYLPYYTEEERHRHDVRPGLTGYAQIQGRNFVKWEERFAIDVEYVANISAILDCKIVFQTFINVIQKRNIMEADKDMKEMDFKDLDKERANV